MIDRKALTGHAARPATSSGYVPSTTYHRRGFIAIREDDTGWLLFLYDPKRDIIEIQRRGRKQIIDLARYKEGDEAEVR